MIVSIVCQELLGKSNATDASGNMVPSDIGVHIQQKVRAFVYSSFSLTVQLNARQTVY